MGLASTAEVLKRVISRPGYSREDILLKMDAFLIYDRITLEQYDEIVALMNQQP